MKKIVTDFSLCTACRICELVCSFKTWGAYNPRYAYLHVVVSEDGLVAEPLMCIHCENPACMKVCPVPAIDRNTETNAVVIDGNKCNGCKACVEACYYQMIRFDSEKKKALKCDLCQGQPECVGSCPTGALRLGEV